VEVRDRPTPDGATLSRPLWTTAAAAAGVAGLLALWNRGSWWTVTAAATGCASVLAALTGLGHRDAAPELGGRLGELARWAPPGGSWLGIRPEWDAALAVLLLALAFLYRRDGGRSECEPAPPGRGGDPHGGVP